MSGPAASRRCRIQVRPNVSGMVRTAAKQQNATQRKQQTATVSGSKTNTDSNEKIKLNSSSRPNSPLKSPPSGSGTVSSDESTSNCGGSPRRHRSTSTSTTTTLSRQQTPLESSEVVPKTRKRFTGDEPLDPKTMTMFDMIWWNPKNDTALKSRENNKKENKDMELSDWQKQQEEEKRQAEAEQSSSKKVKIADDGSLIVDESSLTVVNEQSTSAWETVNEDRSGRKVTSTSFRKRAWRKGTTWSDLETDLFYDILRATGPDFGLMHEFFPSRARAELKSKFNREERTNWARLKKVLSSPTVLNDSLFSHANNLLQKIGEETIRKKEQRMTKKEKKAALQAAEEADTESENVEEDSPNNASVHIKIFDPNNRDTSQSDRADGATEKQTNVTAILAELGVDFPRFSITEEPDTDTVSLERKDSELPLVRMPLNTVLTALQQDDTFPERILFDCPATDRRPAIQFLLQQRMKPSDPPSGFLHLFGPPK
ncbi:unnamed protein product [Anisakis simplex]|uniref:Transcription factor TFIIIB component B'' homolog (inferred by orthology to a human protein) n=1 Tax=Anisakis simplex TaxID=6269 RepID=A0A0M3JUY2_ANISI|nr:unnamed protein product [Anisakis simplex]